MSRIIKSVSLDESSAAISDTLPNSPTSSENAYTDTRLSKRANARNPNLNGSRVGAIHSARYLVLSVGLMANHRRRQSNNGRKTSSPCLG